MNLQVKYNTLSVIYFAVCMVILVLFMCIDMQGLEHAADAVKGAQTITCLSAIALFGAFFKLYLPGYKAYRPNLTITLYFFYLVWIFVPIFSNEFHGNSQAPIVIGAKLMISIFSILLPFNHLQNYGDSKLFGWFFCFASLAFASSFIKVLLEHIAVYQVPTPMIIAYYTLYMLPLIILTCGKTCRIFFIVFTAIMLIVSIKRGGLLAMGCGLISYGFVYAITSKKISWKHIIYSILLISILVAILMLVGDSEENNIMQRLGNIEEDEGSGRTVVWSVTIDLINNSDITSLLFGHGLDAVARDANTGVSAHNDFLEIIYDYGLIGALLYIYAFLSLIWMTYSHIVRKTIYAAPLAMFVTIYLFLSLMSHIAIYTWFNIILLTISYISGRERLDARNK